MISRVGAAGCGMPDTSLTARLAGRDRCGARTRCSDVRSPIQSGGSTVTEDEAREVLLWLSQAGAIAVDPDTPPPARSADPEDDYLIALAASERAILVSGDKDLLDLGGAIPVV